MAEGLAEAGADIIGVSASLEPGSAIEKAVTALGRTFTSYQCDFSDRAAVKAFAAQVIAEQGVPTSSSTTPARSSARPPPSIPTISGSKSST